MRQRRSVVVALLFIVATTCSAAGWSNILKGHKEFMQMVEPAAPRVKRMADAYLQEQKIDPSHLTAAVWLDGGSWAVDYWHAVPAQGFPYDYPGSDNEECPSILTVYLGKGWHLRYEMHAPIPTTSPPLNKYVEHANNVLQQKGHDPQDYQPRAWYFGEWHVDYWRKGVKPADFLVPPALVVHLANARHLDTQTDQLEIPVDPRHAKVKKKRKYEDEY